MRVMGVLTTSALADRFGPSLALLTMATSGLVTTTVTTTVTTAAATLTGIVAVSNSANFRTMDSEQNIFAIRFFFFSTFMPLRHWPRL